MAAPKRPPCSVCIDSKRHRSPFSSPFVKSNRLDSDLLGHSVNFFIVRRWDSEKTKGGFVWIFFGGGNALKQKTCFLYLIYLNSFNLFTLTAEIISFEKFKAHLGAKCGEGKFFLVHLKRIFFLLITFTTLKQVENNPGHEAGFHRSRSQYFLSLFIFLFID